MIVTATVKGTSQIENKAVLVASSPLDHNADNNLYQVTINIPEDGDEEGIPDIWEVENGLDPWSDDSKEDPDNDSLNNQLEYFYGTLPNDLDTDNDGIDDGWEVNNGINPTSDDAMENPDNDSLSNRLEYLYGTDPNNSNPGPAAASLDLPSNGAVGVLPMPTLVASDYSDLNGDPHQRTRWQISTTNFINSDDYVLDVLSTQHLVTLHVPSFALMPGQTYFWRAAFYDDQNGGINWPTAGTFTTEPANGNDADANGLPDIQEVPDGTVDLDGDGGYDTYSNTFCAVNTMEGNNQLAVKAPAGATITNMESISSSDIIDLSGKPESLPFGLLKIRLTVPVGSLATFDVYLASPAPSGAKWYKYDSVNGWQDYSANAVFITQSHVQLTLVDGGIGDADGMANGVIIDPSGIGVGISTAPAAPGISDGGGGGGGGAGVFGSINFSDVVGYHFDWIMKDGIRVYMPVTKGFKALKGAQTHVESFAPDMAKYLRETFDALERTANTDQGGLLYSFGTYIFPLLGEIAANYLNIFDSQDLMENAYSGSMVSVEEFNRLHQQGVAISSHVVK